MFYDPGHGDECPCEMCEPRCICCEARVPKSEAEQHPAQSMCVDCISDVADSMTPRTMKELQDELRALTKFGFGFELRQVRELVQAIDGAEADFMLASNRVAAVDDRGPANDLGLAVAS